MQSWLPAAKNHIALEIRLECWGQDCLVSKGRKGKVLLEEEEFLCTLKPLKLSSRGFQSSQLPPFACLSLCPVTSHPATWKRGSLPAPKPEPSPGS